MQNIHSKTPAPQFRSTFLPWRSPTFRARIALVVLGLVLVGGSIATAAEIQPRDGHWVGVMKFASVSGCSAKMRREIEADAEDEVLYSKTLTFPKPLDLHMLNTALKVDVSWARRGPNHWVGRMKDTERTFFGKIVSITDLDSHVISEGLINQKAVTTVTLPPRLARKFGSSEPCVITSDISHSRR